MKCKKCGRIGRAMMMGECLDIQDCEMERRARLDAFDDMNSELARERELYDYGRAPDATSKWAYEAMLDAEDGHFYDYE